MANQLWSQDSFAKGELSPYMYARATIEQYYFGLKTAQNVICYPQGAAGKRFGTLYKSTLNGFTSANDVYFQTFQYINECVYQVLIKPLAIDVFLEGLFVITLATTLDAQDVANLDYTVIENRFRVSGKGFRPKDLIRSAGAPNIILSTASNEFTMNTPIVADIVLPYRFTTAGTLPVTVPQVKIGITYFGFNTSTSTIKVYASSYNAANDIEPFTITNIGAGVNNMTPLNTWNFTDVLFKNLPIYDFDGGYDAITFTPAATSGAAVALTASSAIFTPAMVGGAYVGGGGIGRIIVFTSTTQVTLAVEQPFDSTAAISGQLSLLAEPAWSNTRGWPQKCSSFQNRSLFANTDSLPNGFWASTINDYSDFNDLQSDDDDAISWFPTSDEVNYIRFIVPYRSVTVHTNSGVYSNPLSVETAITPKNFSLQLQDSTPADKLQPRAIDNQIIVVSGNDVHSLLWDGINNAYTSDIVSIMSEQVIRDPVDEAPYVDLHRAGSRYIFIINASGSLAIYQTLITQNISGWTPNITEQSYGNSYFRQVATNFNGRGWFLTEREVATASAAIAITAFTSSTLTAAATNFSTTAATAVMFTTTGSLPVSSPQIAVLTYYWVIGVTANTFKVYRTQVDAEADEDGIVFTSAGVTSNVQPWPLVTNFFLEELTFDTHLDCAFHYKGASGPTSTLSTLTRFNAQQVKMIGDGFGFDAQVINSGVTFEAHGEPVLITNAYVGLPINMIIEPMPLTISTGGSSKNTSLTRPKHIRSVNFMFNNTVGGTINGVPIALAKFNAAHLGEPPVPQRGIFEMSVMKGWDDFNNPTFTIEHNEPYNIELLGIFYSVDV